MYLWHPRVALLVPKITMPARRLEDRIRDLCARAVFEKGAQWATTIQELQLAIQEHALRVSNLTTAATIVGQPQVVRERRES